MKDRIFEFWAEIFLRQRMYLAIRRGSDWNLSEIIELYCTRDPEPSISRPCMVTHKFAYPEDHKNGYLEGNSQAWPKWKGKKNDDQNCGWTPEDEH